MEAGAPASGLATAFLGTSPTISIERVIQGEIAEDVFEILVPEIQRVDTGGQGVPSLFGRTLTWRSNTPSNTRSLQLTVSSRDGETQIRIEEQLHGFAGGLFGGLVGGGGAGIGIGVGVGVGVDVGSVLFSVAFPLGVIGGCYLLARSIFGATVSRRQRTLHGLMERLTEIVQKEISQKVVEGDETPAALPPGEAPGH